MADTRYPKCLYLGGSMMGKWVTVNDKAEEDKAAQAGFSAPKPAPIKPAIDEAIENAKKMR